MALITQLISDNYARYDGSPDARYNMLMNLLEVQEFPTLASIQARTLEVNPAGIYTWESEWQASNPAYLAYPGCGWKIYRVGAGRQYVLTTEEMDHIVASATAGSKFMMTLLSTARGDNPAWLPFTTGGVPNIAGDNLFIANFNTYASSILDLYGPSGSYWTGKPTPHYPIEYVEIYNEPNLHYMLGNDWWGQLTHEQMEDLYARLLISASNHIHANYPGVKVVGGSALRGAEDDMGTILSWDEAIHQRIVANGGVPANCYDVWSDHYYQWDWPCDVEARQPSYHFSMANETKNLRDIMAAYGTSAKPIWVTEIGWHRTNGAYPANSKPFHNTERQQAAYVVRAYMLALRLGIDRINIMMSQDADSFNGGFLNSYNYSVFYENKTALNVFLALLPFPSFISAISDGVAGYFGYVLKPDRTIPGETESVIMLWNAEGAATKTISLAAGDYTIHDMFGGTDPLTSDGSVDIEVGPYPIYITGITGEVEPPPPDPPPGDGELMMLLNS